MRNLIAIIVLTCCAATSVVAQNSNGAVAPDRITVRIVPGVTSSRQLPSAALIRARRNLAQGRSVSSSDLRQLADLGDGFAAVRFAQRLEQQTSEIPKSDIAHYFGIAAATGRGGSINGMIRMLDQLEAADISTSRSDILKGIMFQYAFAGNSRAIDALFRYQARQQPFGPLDDELVELLDEATGEGAAQMGLQIAMSILRNNDASTPDLIRANAYLERAATAETFETVLLAQNAIPLVQSRLQSRRDLAAAAQGLDGAQATDTPLSLDEEPTTEVTQ